MKVQVAAADTAVVGKDITGEYRWLDVFVKWDGDGKSRSDQGTQIAKSQ